MAQSALSAAGRALIAVGFFLGLAGIMVREVDSQAAYDPPQTSETVSKALARLTDTDILLHCSATGGSVIGWAVSGDRQAAWFTSFGPCLGQVRQFGGGQRVNAELVLAIAMLMGLAAALYSTVGHGGASAYIAIMALFAVAPDTMRPTALALNLVAAGIAAWRYGRAGQVNWRLVALFALAAAPAAYFAGSVQLPPALYKTLVGVLLWLAAIRLFWNPAAIAGREPLPPRAIVAIPAGAGLGALAGLTGTGGGIFLSPLIILLGWEDTRRTSGVVAVFILINSIAGLAGNVSSVGKLPQELPWFACAVAIGALVGSYLGSRRLDKRRLLQALGLVLMVAGAKLVFA